MTGQVTILTQDIDPEMEQIADSAWFEHVLHARRNRRFIKIHSQAAGCENFNS
ncbi:MAG: hypothetical protein GY807_13860 [Gammaproteobacteria bacterium]|nr:hypothetical protein [Gammaproteobacteria bacterium]